MLEGLAARCFFFVGLALFRWSRSAELTEWPELGGRSLVAHGDTPLSPIALKWPGVDPGQHSFSSSLPFLSLVLSAIVNQDPF